MAFPVYWKHLRLSASERSRKTENYVLEEILRDNINGRVQWQQKPSATSNWLDGVPSVCWTAIAGENRVVFLVEDGERVTTVQMANEDDAEIASALAQTEWTFGPPAPWAHVCAEYPLFAVCRCQAAFLIDNNHSNRLIDFPQNPKVF